MGDIVHEASELQLNVLGILELQFVCALKGPCCLTSSQSFSRRSSTDQFGGTVGGGNAFIENSKLATSLDGTG